MTHSNFIGIGIGPFNLSLAAMLEKVPEIQHLFFDQKPGFEWHSELMFEDADMQTSYLKDLATPVDPTSPYSFLNYLVQNGLFFSFMNTGRRTITRREFEMYCQWASAKLSSSLQFSNPVEEIDFSSDRFVIRTKNGLFTSDHICVGTGLSPQVPACAKDFIGDNVFHAKSGRLRDINLANKRVVIVGGGQTGLEVFRACLNDKWGRVTSVRMVSGRHNLEPLDESPFTNEYFTPRYVDEFFDLSPERKEPLVRHQKLASDGNTPAYLEMVYNDLYRLKNVQRDQRPIDILPLRHLRSMQARGLAFELEFENSFNGRIENLEADVVILCTGFESRIPKALEPLRSRISFDAQGRFVLNRSFSVKWDGPENRRIYAVNFSRHCHGISEPQTSLMAWRSATIIDDILGKPFYLKTPCQPNLINYNGIEPLSETSES